MPPRTIHVFFNRRRTRAARLASLQPMSERIAIVSAYRRRLVGLQVPAPDALRARIERELRALLESASR